MLNSSTEKVSCPVCSDDLLSSGCLPVQLSGCGVELRQCLGVCLCCGRTVHLLQFMDKGQWITSKYRFSDILQDESAGILEAWQVAKELPEPPAVAIGPGGDYVENVNIKPSRIMQAVRRLFHFKGDLISASSDVKHGVRLD